MNKLLTGVLVSLLCIGYPFNNADAQDTATGTMVIIVDNIKSNKGQIAISLANSKESYNGEHYRAVYAEAQKGKIKYEFTDVPFGTYAIKIYHDKNKSKELDTGMFGRPTEPYGFSNNASASFGPAPWENARFQFKKDGQKIHIKLK